MAEPSGFGILASFPGAWKIFLAILLGANIVTGAFYALATRWQLLPAIRNRDVHTERKPRVGGVAMWLVAILAVVIIMTGNRSGLLSFAPGVLRGIFAGLGIVLIFGLIDDLIGLSPLFQVFGQFLAGAALVMSGLRVEYLRLPFAGQVAINPAWSALFVVAWIMVMINAINLFDGLDGLAGSLSFTASIILLLVSLKLGFMGAATLCVIIAGITAGFLPWNWYPSKLFMGTVGSQLLGFLLGTVAVVSGAKVATAVLVLGIPLFDAFIVVLRRLAAHESPFKADQRHLHHRLLKIGFKPPVVVFVTSLFAVIFGVFALGTQQASEKALLIGVLIISMLIFIWLTYLLEKRADRA